ncbi:MAG: endonuclease domain-containing protein [Dehalococcoidia bacterium]
MKKDEGRIALARWLRRHSTDAERVLWPALRNRQLAGAKFRRQQPLGPYIVDFASFEKRLVVEIDGGQHNETDERDETRTAWLTKHGFTVLRFWNNEVLANKEGVLEKIATTVGRNDTPNGQ